MTIDLTKPDGADVDHGRWRRWRADLIWGEPAETTAEAVAGASVDESPETVEAQVPASTQPNSAPASRPSGGEESADEEQPDTGDTDDEASATRWGRIKKLAAKGVQPEPEDQERDEYEPEDGEHAPAAQPPVGPGQMEPPAPEPGHVRLRASRFVRFLAFNGSAAALGSAVGLGSYFGQFNAAAAEAAHGLLTLAGTFGAGWAAWKLIRHDAVREILPGGLPGLLVRVGAVFGVAELGRQYAPLILPTAIGYGAYYTGLTVAQVELLITGIALCGSTGYLVWHFRKRGLPLRWISRVPLATAVLSCALYS